jgi:hypothetical protein
MADCAKKCEEKLIEITYVGLNDEGTTAKYYVQQDGRWVTYGGPTAKDNATNALEKEKKAKEKPLPLGEPCEHADSGCHCIILKREMEAQPGRKTHLEVEFSDPNQGGRKTKVRVDAHRRVGIGSGVCDEDDEHGH